MARERAQGWSVPPLNELPLPRTTQAVVALVPLAERHPGLQLDRLVIPGDQERQRASLLEVVRVPGDRSLFAEVRLRREGWLKGMRATVWPRSTAAPLTLHLARANALENAGLCLHPVYGFPYLPGSGLKGMARAYASEVLGLKDSPEIREVFGNKPGAEEKEAQQAGAIVFHDAWPKDWPALIVDITNNHHPRYYQGEDAPGDWDSPIPVYFLAVKTGAAFEFALAGRRADVNPELLELARQWLDGALTSSGAGAKTAAGYGSFRADKWPPIPPTRREAVVQLELVTPAFLAGATLDGADCELRPATLRGHLRWWWRTLHAGFLTAPELRALEAAVWGDITAGSTVRVTVESVGDIAPLPFDRSGVTRMNRLPEPPDKKTTQGLTYHSYGMDEKKGRRWFVEPGAKWCVRLTARPIKSMPTNDAGLAGTVSAELILAQATAALGLLCRFGGVGSKGRKGFGSFVDLPTFDLAEAKQQAAELRRLIGLGTRTFDGRLVESPCMEQLLGPVEVDTQGTNHWLALDQLAAAAQHFAKRYKHQLVKKALGLPRRVGSPTTGNFRPGQNVEDRHSSPVLYHLAKSAGGTLIARVVAFPAVRLPDLAASRALLQELLDALAGSLPDRFRDYVAGKGKVASGGGPTVRTMQQAGPVVKPGERVTAKMVEDPKGKGRPFAECHGLVGNILNPADLPSGWKVGDQVPLVVNSVNLTAKQIAFRAIKG